MFNLFRSRDKSVRILLGVLLGLVALSMITYLVPSGPGTDTNVDPSVVATVGSESETAQEVSKTITSMTRNRQLPPELLSIYVPQIIQQMINERAMAYEAGRLGLKVSADETQNAIIDSLPPQLVKDGKVDGTTLAGLLQQQGMTLADLQNQTSRQVLISKLEQIVAQGVVISPKDVEAEYKKKNDKIKVDYVVLQPIRFQQQAEPTETELKAYYEAHKAEFRVGEKKSYAIIVLDPTKLASSMPTDAQLQAEYTARRNDFQTPERVRARHILVKSDATNDTAMKAKAEGILKQLQGGDFAALAKANSDDPGSKEQGGELGFLVRGQTVPEFDKAAFSLNVGQTSGLIKTTYGYHIIQVEQHEQARLQPIEEVKAQLTIDYQKRLAGQQMQTLADKAVAELRKDPTHPEKAAAAVGMQVLKAENLQAGEPVPGVGASKDFNDAVASLRKGEVTAGPVALPNGQAVLAAVTDVQAPRSSTYEEAKAEAKTKATDEKLKKILEDKGNELLAKTQAMGGDLLKAAKALNLEGKTSNDVDRQGAIESVGTASTLSDAWLKPAGTILGPLNLAGGKVVAKVVAKTPANMAELAMQAETIKGELRQTRARERAQLFQDGLKDRLKADGKLKIHDDVMKRILANYQRS